MKAVLCAIGLAVGCGLAVAQNAGTGNAAGTATQGATGTGTTGALAPNEFWAQHSKGGYMTKDDAMTFKGADGKSIDMQKLDTDNDGRISEREWSTYTGGGTTGATKQ